MPSPFIESIRQEIRVRHYSLKTEKSYLFWIRQFIRYHNMKHPKDMSNSHIETFLSYLANERKVSSATQNQALCAIIFMYRHVLKVEIQDLRYSFTKKPKRMPTVLTQEEVNLILDNLNGQYWLLCALLYGCGLRINEALGLRIKDLNFENQTIYIFRGKGAKDRYTLLPTVLITKLKNQIKVCLDLHKRDCEAGFGLTSLPSSLIKKYGNAAKDPYWQYLFPSTQRCLHPLDGYTCRHHLHESAFRKQLRGAVKKSGVLKRVTAHTFRHSFATQLLRSGSDIRTVQELLGHSDVRTTELYTHVIGSKFGFTKSPLD